ncbi:WhiB family transcriptional regulator [Mycobacterium sp. pW045]|uniref:WhiB family transcriptional regulator n=1 Tax=Mycobacterium sp. pW045 TaxID=3238984 RepID=UPI00351BB455
MSALNGEAVIDLLAAIFRDMPALPGAACRDRQAVFQAAEDGHDDAIASALAICRGCPVRRECAQWVGSIHRHRRPRGVTGGAYRPAGRGRRPRQAVAS